MNTELFGCVENTIITRSRRYLDFVNPAPEQITIEAIAAGLAKACRFAGQCDRFYSVAEHCILGAETASEGLSYSPIFMRAFLLHDASEAFTGDLPKPLKVILPEFQVIEDRLQEVIESKFGVDSRVADRVKEVDKRMLVAEKQQLFPDDESIWHGFETIQPMNVNLLFLDPVEAEKLFLAKCRGVGIA